MKNWVGSLSLVVFGFLAPFASPLAQEKRPVVYVAPIEGIIDLGLAPFVQRVLDEAAEAGAAAVILEINTFGGRVDAAVQIRDALLNSKVRTVAFVNKRAISAGALIALATQDLVMAGGGTIGAATPVQMGQPGAAAQPVAEKTVSYVRKEFRATAESRKRPPLLAEAMVDADVEIPGVIEKGKLLTLTTEEALKHKLADFRADSIESALENLGIREAELRRASPNWAEHLVRFLTHPVVSSLLMTIGMLGIIVGVRTGGFGVAAGVGTWASGAYVGLFTLIGMRLRRVPPTTVVTARISAVKAGLDISINDLEAHFLAGGNVVRVVNAMISADKANIPLPFKRAAAIDLAGRNVLEAVQMSVLPKVIQTPKIAAVAKDGIQLIAVCLVTVRTNIDRLVGGAGEETIIARVGEGMVSTIGSSASHKSVLESPDHISKHVLSKGLDAGTAYEILSIDVADVTVGENIGAKLQIDQANADKQIAQAKAEERRAMAVALEQEMRARVVEAEAEVPRAMAEAFRQGNMGIMDYYRMKNVQADTVMREEIASAGDDPAASPRK